MKRIFLLGLLFVIGTYVGARGSAIVSGDAAIPPYEPDPIAMPSRVAHIDPGDGAKQWLPVTQTPTDQTAAVYRDDIDARVAIMNRWFVNLETNRVGV